VGVTIEERKDSHLDICLHEEVDAKIETTLFEDVYLIHQALPEMDLESVDLSVNFLGHKLAAPLLIDSMTGGTSIAKEVNKTLAILAERNGIGIGVGSQRAGLTRPNVAETYSVVRKEAPNAFVFGNLGGVQLVRGVTLEDARKAVDMIQADALAVHLNPLQEAVQVGGEATYKGILDKIGELAHGLEVPVIVKEVGAGISREAASHLALAGVKAINVSGLGGTSWAGVESIRARRKGETAMAELGETFWDWGIPTAAALLEVRKAVNLPVIASGGIRTGIEAAKAIVLGADVVAMARPFLYAASNGGVSGAQRMTDAFLSQLKLASFLTGSRNIASLKKARHVLTGKLLDWKQSLGDQE
jgi:isopentenyl-diphosphate delta-isomerase